MLILNGQAVDVAGGKAGTAIAAARSADGQPAAPQPQAPQIAAATPPALNAARPAAPAPAQQQASPILVLARAARRPLRVRPFRIDAAPQPVLPGYAAACARRSSPGPVVAKPLRTGCCAACDRSNSGVAAASADGGQGSARRRES